MRLSKKSKWLLLFILVPSVVCAEDYYAGTPSPVTSPSTITAISAATAPVSTSEQADQASSSLETTGFFGTRFRGGSGPAPGTVVFAINMCPNTLLDDACRKAGLEYENLRNMYRVFCSQPFPIIEPDQAKCDAIAKAMKDIETQVPNRCITQLKNCMLFAQQNGPDETSGTIAGINVFMFSVQSHAYLDECPLGDGVLEQIAEDCKNAGAVQGVIDPVDVANCIGRKVKALLGNMNANSRVCNADRQCEDLYVCRHHMNCIGQVLDKLGISNSVNSTSNHVWNEIRLSQYQKYVYDAYNGSGYIDYHSIYIPVDQSPVDQ